MTVALLSHPACALHEMGPLHPERPARLAAVEDQLIASGIEPLLRRYEAPRATREQLARVHDPRYVDRLLAAAPDEGLVWVDGDTAMNRHTPEAALRAAGAAVAAVDLVMAGEIESAFCNVRPPGHHAERARAGGFCFFNNVAVACAHALAVHGLSRVAIVDFDVHHGNGTEEAFRDDPRVLYCSSFQHPHYPYTDPADASDHIIKMPLPAGSGGAAFRAAMEQAALPRLHAFRPELVLISAGFDAHTEDDLADLHLTEQDYVWVTQAIQSVARAYAGGRLVSLLEGGYALSALGRAAAAHVRTLLG